MSTLLRTSWNKGLVGYRAGSKSHLWKGGKSKSNCRYCDTQFEYWASSQKGIYCSKTCSNRANAKQGELNPNWNENVGYTGLHMWVYSKLGKPKKCEHCGKDNLKGKFIQWANKSGDYSRDVSDWLRLCGSCHKKYDLARINHASN